MLPYQDKKAAQQGLQGKHFGVTAVFSSQEIYSLTNGEFSALQTAWMEDCSSIYSHARLRKALPKPDRGNHNPAYGSWEIPRESLIGRCLVFLLYLIINMYQPTCMFGTSQMHLAKPVLDSWEIYKNSDPKPSSNKWSDFWGEGQCQLPPLTLDRTVHVLEQEYTSVHFSASASLKHSVRKHQWATYVWSELPLLWTSLFSWVSTDKTQTHPIQEHPWF